MFEENWDEPETTHVVSQSCSNVEVPNANINYKERKTHFSSASQRFKNDSCWRANNNANNFSKRDTFNDRRRNSNDLVLRVEGRKIGMIIGRQGSKIKELTEKSGARIKIGGPSKDDDYLTEVFIIGSVESQNSCKLLIDDLLGENKESPLFSSAPAVDSSVPLIDWDTINEKAVVAEAKRWEKCPPLKKDFYFEDPEVAKLSEEEVEQFRKNNNNIVVRNISDSNEKILNPVQTFAQAFKLYPEIMREIEKQGFQTPSPIQAQAWPILLSGKDLIGIAQTGTGKTLAFLLPALIHIDGQTIPRSERGGANVLVIAPTRELALQIESEVKKYSYKGIKCVCVYGGGNRREQMKVVASGVEIIIATPGRLNDLVEANVIDVSSITYVVLDEADRMLDMGFEPQIKKVLLDIRPDRQSVMTSATWPSNVQRLAERYMNNPIQVYIGSLDLAAVHSVTQTVLVIDEDDKRDCVSIE
ncbi:hypothetical protein RUM43_013080 [Polyplax serrata]|uniref:RNA helicase n=1 Tax=Polyplax serrata TaxID=468196 RepID=A0AAN8NRH1_POLSC